jgi:GNAT superfamily N-acetyltransferase
MPTIRYATSYDAAAITEHRHRMFGDNNFTSEAALSEADAEFEPWVRARLEDGRYVGLFLEDKGRLIAAAGIFFADFPPHWMNPQPLRAYVLNVYTVAEERGKGHAKRLMQAVIDECCKRNVPTIVLHASPLGRPVYESLGFAPTDEMMLRLNAAKEHARRSK